MVLRAVSNAALAFARDPKTAARKAIHDSSVVTNVEQRLKYLLCMSPEQQQRSTRRIAAEIRDAVLALSKEAAL